MSRCSNATNATDEDAETDNELKYLQLQQEFEEFQESSRAYEEELETEVEELKVSEQNQINKALKLEMRLEDMREEFRGASQVQEGIIRMRENQVESLSRELAQLKKTNRNLDMECERLERELRRVTAQNELVASEAEELQEANVCLETELAELTQKKAKVQELSLTVQLLKKELEEKSEKIWSLQQTVDHLKVSEKAFEELQKTLTHEREEFERRIQEYDKKREEEWLLQQLSEAENRRKSSAHHDSRQRAKEIRAEQREARREVELMEELRTNKDKSFSKVTLDKAKARLQDTTDKLKQEMSNLAMRREVMEKSASAVYDRLTDHSKYTGSHKAKHNERDRSRSPKRGKSVVKREEQKNRKIYVCMLGDIKNLPIPLTITRAVTNLEKCLQAVTSTLAFVTGPCRRMFLINAKEKSFTRLVDVTKIQDLEVYLCCATERTRFNPKIPDFTQLLPDVFTTTANYNTPGFLDYRVTIASAGFIKTGSGNNVLTPLASGCPRAKEKEKVDLEKPDLERYWQYVLEGMEDMTLLSILERADAFLIDITSDTATVEVDPNFHAKVKNRKHLIEREMNEVLVGERTIEITAAEPPSATSPLHSGVSSVSATAMTSQRSIGSSMKAKASAIYSGLSSSVSSGTLPSKSHAESGLSSRSTEPKPAHRRVTLKLAGVSTSVSTSHENRDSKLFNKRHSLKSNKELNGFKSVAKAEDLSSDSRFF